MGDLLLLCGPTGAGKSRRIVDEYGRHAAKRADDAVALIAPTARAASRMSAQIVRGGKGLYDPRVFTFPTLAETLLDANHKPVRRISELQRRLLLADVVKRLVREDRIPYLSGVSEFRGFINAASDIIDELKRAAIQPVEFADIARTRIPDHPANDDVAAIYETYQQELTARSLYDEAGAFWEARDLLRDGKRRPLESVELLLVDGFSEFTTTQLEVLALLCREIPQTIISLCLEPEGREELFGVTRRTRRRLAERFPNAREEWVTPQLRESALAGVRAGMFGEAQRGELCDDGSVRVPAAPGMRAEIRLLARRIKERLLEGASPGDIAVVLRSLDTYDTTIREVFEEYGIPFEMTHGERPAGSPAVRAVLDILDILAGDYRRQDVVKLLNSNYVSLEGIAPSAGPLTADEFEAAALGARIIGGRASWARQLAAYRGRLQAKLRRAEDRVAEDEEAEPPRSPEVIRREYLAAERSADLLTNLMGLLSPIEAADTLPRAVRALSAAVDELQIVARVTAGAVDTAGVGRDLVALGLLFEGLRELGEAGEELGVSERISSGELGAHAKELCATLRARGRRIDGAVCVLDVHEARQLRYAEVFIPGLTEGAFPLARRQDPFYDDEARRRLNGDGVLLEERLPQQSEEAFLFYSALSAATERVWLSYPTADAEGQPRLRSYYVDEVLRQFSEPPGEEVARLSEVVPVAEMACSPRELAEAGLKALWQPAKDSGGGGARAGGILPALREVHGDGLVGMMESARVEDQRDSSLPPAEFDGVLTGPLVHAVLRERFGHDHRFSASQFATYGQCPMRFFLVRVLDVAALEEPTEEVQPRDLGSIAHRVLEGFFRERQEGTDQCHPLGEHELAAESERMAGAVRSVFAEWERLGRVLHRKLWALTEEGLQEDLRSLLEFEVASNEKKGPRTVWATEYAYGTSGDFAVGEGDDRVLIEGRVDRIDVVPDTDPLRFIVLDYKTGKGKSTKEILAGTDFQLPLYCMAAQRGVFEGREAECAWWAYYRVRSPVKWECYGHADGKTPIAELLAAAQGHIVDYAEQIRTGHFAVTPKACDQFCEYKGVCRYSPQRMARKSAAV